jgi:hypothetical protein
MLRILKNSFLFLLLMNVSSAMSQDNSDSDNTENTGPQKHWKIGMYVGSYFANKYTASAYDGYGFDITGKRNQTFESSYMYEKIINEYGGYNGYGIDQIAAALNVNHGDWFFTKDDMPVNMHYTPAFILGIEGRYSVDKKNAVELNMNFAKITANGNFTITTRPPTGSTQINNSIQTFGIKGGEQRLMLQLGYCRLLGDNENLNFLIEGGMNVTYAKFSTNQILINTLKIDLTGFYDFQGIQANYTKKPVGFGLGAYGGFGLNFSSSNSYTVQLVYNPSYEGIKIVENSKLKWQHAIALRAYYNF